MSRRSTRRNYSEKLEDQYEAEVEEDAEDDEQEVTRCVCDQDELNTDTMNESLAKLLDTEYQIKIDTGLFIQCDKCSVWQHGYCVGLFINEDVPDKYWCEQCKPDLHILVFESPEIQRTLYRPVNDKRKKLLADNERYSRRKLTRKDRRHYDYDEQLQKALRESALEEEKRKRSGDEDQEVEPEEEEPPAEPVKEETEAAAVPVVEDKEAEGDEEDEAEAEEDEPQPEERKEVKKKVKRVRKKEQRKPKRQKTDASEPQFTKEELISQPSKPRFVHEKSSIYELRKRISAILEWLNRSQLELEDEKETRSKMTGDPSLIEPIKDNIVLMQGLTESILNWEQKFGKFAP